MSTKIEIKFKPEGFAECLQGLSGTVQSQAEVIAARAASYLTNGGGFHVEMTNKARFQDASYGVTRPVAYVTANDEETSKEEYKNKILTKAVRG